MRSPEIILEIRKDIRFLKGFDNPIIHRFLRDPANNRKKTYRATVLSLRPIEQ